jgi:hypothetical protein
MDPRIRLLVDDVRRLHQPLLHNELFNNRELESYCWACEGLEYDCPVLKAADELEKEYDE